LPKLVSPESGPRIRRQRLLQLPLMEALVLAVAVVVVAAAVVAFNLI
jgi:hypothetical protein